MRRLVEVVVFAGMLLRLGAAAAEPRPPWPLPAAAERAVAAALTANLTLQSRGADVELARAQLQEARSHYWPRLDVTARYTRADGGRTIDLPIGDLMNPVYGALGLSQRVANESIPLLRGREQETKLRLTQPLYRPEIARMARATREQLAAREATLAAYRRELREAVLTAYFHHGQAAAAVRILESAQQVTAEALRVNRLLAEAEKITVDRVLRAEADDLAVRQQRAEAERDRNQARAFFNFLLNRPLATEIEPPTAEELRSLQAAVESAGAWSELGVAQREELQALERGVAAAAAVESARAATGLPTVGVAVEGGVQGESYRTGRGAEFMAGSVVAEFNLFDGRQRQSAVAQARAERRKAELRLAEARQQLELQLQQAIDECTAARVALAAAGERREAARQGFALVAAREREGLANQLGFLDARSELTRAELNYEIVRQRLFIAAVALDRAAALSPLP